MADSADRTIEAFRQDVRAWVDVNFPPDLKGLGNPIMLEERPKPTEEQVAWRKAVGEKGWGTPTWPSEYGGAGLSSAHARVIHQEFARAGAHNPIGGMGVMMFGPTLLEYGTEEQKLEHIPPICRGEVQWCQGYSEPGAGSDLASCRRDARTWATTIGSTARRFGHRAPNGRIGASVLFEPIPRRSMKASHSCSSPCTSQASRCGRSS